MAERNQLARALRSLDGGNAGNAQNIALLCAATRDLLQRGRPHADPALRPGDAYCLALRRNIDHACLTPRVKMGELVHGASACGQAQTR